MSLYLEIVGQGSGSSSDACKNGACIIYFNFIRNENLNSLPNQGSFCSTNMNSCARETGIAISAYFCLREGDENGPKDRAEITLFEKLFNMR